MGLWYTGNTALWHRAIRGPIPLRSTHSINSGWDGEYSRIRPHILVKVCYNTISIVRNTHILGILRKVHQGLILTRSLRNTRKEGG